MLSKFPIVGGGAAAQIFSDDVFSSFLYTGNGSTQTITNGIDLAGKGGLVWIKSRNQAHGHNMLDSAVLSLYGKNANGFYRFLSSNTTSGVTSPTEGGFTSFNSNGFSLFGNGATGFQINNTSDTYTSWTFRKAPKFFDVVTYTGNGTTQNIAHNLGVTPGMIIVKRLDAVGDWSVWHKDASTLYLNTTAAATSNIFGTVNASTFGVTSISYLNASGGSFVAYVLAHDTATDGIIQCGSWTGTGTAQQITLGWEPQFILAKNASSPDNWFMIDTMRSWPATVSSAVQLYSNSTSAEVSSNKGAPNATGFSTSGYGEAVGNLMIYLAIRRPNKPPTTGAQVYNAVIRTATAAAVNVTGVGFSPDLVMTKKRSGGTAQSLRFTDRLRGAGLWIGANSTAETYNADTITNFSMDGFGLGADATALAFNAASTNTYVDWCLRRSPGVFDIVSYLGTGVAGNVVSHNLGVAPEMMWVRRRFGSNQLYVYHKDIGNTYFGSLSTDAAFSNSLSPSYWNNTTPSASSFSLNASAVVNQLNEQGIAYLFATKAGISKVFSYTGNGSSQTINCGFSTGARFVLIKRTDATGDWYIWDTARGIVTANDPYLGVLAVAEVTTNDSIDPDASGFIVNQVAATNINVTSATYIGLAIA